MCTNAKLCVTMYITKNKLWMTKEVQMIATTLINGLGASGGIFAGIKKLIYKISHLSNVFANIIAGLIEYIFFVIYMIFYAICQIILLSESLFLRLAGIQPLASGPTGGTVVGGQQNILLEIILNKTVVNIFISMAVLAIVLMFIFSFIAIVKSEFTLDSKKAAKGPIIVRALKGLAMLVVVPVTCVLGIYVSQGLTQTVYRMFNNDTTSMYSIVFQTAAYDANRVRNNPEFHKYLTGQVKYKNDDTGEEESILPLQSANRLNGQITDRMDQDVAAALIDDAFRQEIKMTTNWNSSGKAGWVQPGSQDTHMYMFDYPSNGGYYTAINPLCVHYFYDMTMFNYLIGLVSGAILGWTLFGVSLALVKRMFNIGILFLISPAAICMYPLDDGQATKSWTKKMVGSVISIITAVFAFNVFFLLLPIIYSIKPFATGFSGVVSSGALGALTPEMVGMGGFFNLIFQVVVICVGAGMIKNASKLVNGLLGVEDDLIGEGSAMAGKGLQGVAKVGGALGGAVLKKMGIGVGAGKAKKEAEEEAREAGKSEDEIKAAGKDAAARARKAGRKGSLTKGFGSAFKAVMGSSDSGKAIMEAKDTLAENMFGAQSKEEKDAIKAEKTKRKAAATVDASEEKARKKKIAEGEALETRMAMGVETGRTNRPNVVKRNKTFADSQTERTALVDSIIETEREPIRAGFIRTTDFASSYSNARSHGYGGTEEEYADNVGITDPAVAALRSSLDSTSEGNNYVQAQIALAARRTVIEEGVNNIARASTARAYDTVDQIAKSKKYGGDAHPETEEVAKALRKIKDKRATVDALKQRYEAELKTAKAQIAAGTGSDTEVQRLEAAIAQLETEMNKLNI